MLVANFKKKVIITGHAQQHDAALIDVDKTEDQKDDTVSVNNEQPVNNKQNDAALAEVTKTEDHKDYTGSVNNAQPVKTTQESVVPAVPTSAAVE